MTTGRTFTIIVLLSFTAGALDGALFSLYDKAFASIMTGNMILLGVGAAAGSVQQLIILAAALAGYVLGVAMGARTVRNYSDLFHRKHWPMRVVVNLCLTCSLLVTSFALSLVVGGDPQLLPPLFFLLALGMGIMAAAVRRIGHSVSATYLTGSITQFWERVATRSPLAETGRASLVGVGALISGAVVGGVLSTYFGEFALLLPIGSVTGAIVVVLLGNALQQEVAHAGES